MRVELVYDRDCPNIARARSALIMALARAGIPARWREWDRSDVAAPAYARRFGSPSILIDGEDVYGLPPCEDAASCRIYPDAHGSLTPAPAVDAIYAALNAAVKKHGALAKPGHGVAAASAAVGLALVPKLVCPLCFPAYAAILSAVGLEFFDYTPYLLPLTAALLSIVTLVLARQARRSGRFFWLAAGATASAVILAAKFDLDNSWLTGAGLALLVAAVVQSGRATRALGAACPACVNEGHGEERIHG